ncbi:hypothetical protein QUF80_13065 [Desulfococcaceae bacterium HSG8]|nr:hypothetical protein [Desulfococcaceae bacterium HSG8]
MPMPIGRWRAALVIFVKQHTSMALIPKAGLSFVFSTRGKTDGKSVSERMLKAEKSADSLRLAGQQLIS